MRVNDEVLNEDQVFIVLGMISSWLVLAMSSMLFISFMEPSWSLDESLKCIIDWNEKFMKNENMYQYSVSVIRKFNSL